MFRLFIVTVVKKGEGRRRGERREGGREETKQEIVAAEESSAWWEVLRAALIGLTAFGGKEGGGSYLLYVGATCFTCVRMFVLCICEYVCVCLVLACETGRWRGAEYVGSGLCLSLSCLFCIQLCGLQRRMMCEVAALITVCGRVSVCACMYV